MHENFSFFHHKLLFFHFQSDIFYDALPAIFRWRISSAVHQHTAAPIILRLELAGVLSSGSGNSRVSADAIRAPIRYNAHKFTAANAADDERNRGQV